jgi:hypothetical protein
VEAVAAALPAHWRVAEQDRVRTLYLDDAPVTRIVYSGAPRWSGTVRVENTRYHYHLTIQFAAPGN